jgi:multiple sugar transport system permease protein
VRALAWVAALVVAAPLWVLVVGSLEGEAASAGAGRLPLVPRDLSLRGYAEALTLVPLARGLARSALVATIAVPLSLVVASAAAFTLLGAPARVQRGGVIVLVALAAIPASALWVPRFVLFHAAGLLGTLAPLVAPALVGGSPLLVPFYYAAMRRIPPDVLDAARLEGLGPVAVWWRVALPLVAPATFAIGLVAGVQYWSAFLDALLYSRGAATQTAPVLLHVRVELGSTSWPTLLAGAVVVTLPAVLAFSLAHRWLTERAGGLW